MIQLNTNFSSFLQAALQSSSSAFGLTNAESIIFGSGRAHLAPGTKTRRRIRNRYCGRGLGLQSACSPGRRRCSSDVTKGERVCVVTVTNEATRLSTHTVSRNADIWTYPCSRFQFGRGDRELSLRGRCFRLFSRTDWAPGILVLHWSIRRARRRNPITHAGRTRGSSQSGG